MALDFAILGGDGAPATQVSIRADPHYRLMELARSLGSPRLERVASYYEDAEFAPADLPALLEEIEALLERQPDDPEVVVFLHSLRDLASAARVANAPIAVIAD